VTANTVTLQGLRDKIKGATYTLMPNGRTTICQLTLENGFTVEGQSACVHKSIYNRALGEKYAYDDALENCWKFEGYLLAERLYQEAQLSDVLLKDLAEALESANAGVQAAAQLHSSALNAWPAHANIGLVAINPVAPAKGAGDPSYYASAKRMYQAYHDAGSCPFRIWDDISVQAQATWIAVAKAA
jgi:hypothetical protein